MRIGSVKSPWKAWLTVALMLVVLAGCPAPGVEPTQTPAPEEPIYQCEPGAPQAASAAAVAGAHYVLNQAIIIGPEDGVKQVIDEVSQKDGGFLPIQTCTLRAPAATRPKGEPGSEADAGSAANARFSPEQRGNLAFSLLSTPAQIPTEEAIAMLREAGSGRQVFVDPNYLTGPLDTSPARPNPVSPCAVERDPFEVGGSPFEVGGSPFEVGGSSNGGSGAPANADIFWKQWAFQEIKLGSDGRGRGELTGDGVTVAIFDTSPFRQGDTASIHDANLNLDLALGFPPLANPLEPVERLTASGAMTMPVTVADHGLFAAGLVRAVTPNSQIHLIRVLNDYGCGDLWSLNNALNSFVDQQSKDQSLDKVVLNLSLGVHQPRDLDTLNWPEEIVTLDETLRNAHAMGAVIVAASGNDSYPTMVPGPMQLPAAWSYVVGVAATNPAAATACYSNRGHVAAPGGDGGPWKNNPCQPVADQCASDDPGCKLGVVSLSTQPTPGYRFWVGTSFAAPLVSGQAALLLDADVPGANVKQCILDTAASHAGVSVIDIAASTAPAAVRRCR